MIIRNARVLVGQYDLSGDHNSISVELNPAERDGTTFGHTAENLVPAMPAINVTGAGFVTLGPGEAHDVLRRNLGVADVPFTVISGDPDDGPQAIEFFKATEFTYKHGAEVNNLLAFSYTVRGRGQAPVAGRTLQLAPVVADGGGAMHDLGVLPAGQTAYAAIHVLAVTGTAPTLDVSIQTADAEDPLVLTPVAAFPQMTGPGSAFISIHGPTPAGQPWWRAMFDVGGTAPNFDLVVILGK
jgi:hypothetical protein